MEAHFCYLKTLTIGRHSAHVLQMVQSSTDEPYDNVPKYYLQTSSCGWALRIYCLYMHRTGSTNNKTKTNHITLYLSTKAEDNRNAIFYHQSFLRHCRYQCSKPHKEKESQNVRDNFIIEQKGQRHRWLLTFMFLETKSPFGSNSSSGLISLIITMSGKS